LDPWRAAKTQWALVGLNARATAHHQELLGSVSSFLYSCLSSIRPLSLTLGDFDSDKAHAPPHPHPLLGQVRLLCFCRQPLIHTHPGIVSLCLSWLTDLHPCTRRMAHSFLSKLMTLDPPESRHYPPQSENGLRQLNLLIPGQAEMPNIKWGMRIIRFCSFLSRQD
jgi:hypothetical protein